jgi:hypothetical protein
VTEKSIDELVNMADELMRALPLGAASVTPALEQKFLDIVGSLSREDWGRLWAVFVLRYMPDYAKEILAS